MHELLTMRRIAFIAIMVPRGIQSGTSRGEERGCKSYCDSFLRTFYTLSDQLLQLMLGSQNICPSLYIMLSAISQEYHSTRYCVVGPFSSTTDLLAMTFIGIIPWCCESWQILSAHLCLLKPNAGSSSIIWRSAHPF